MRKGLQIILGETKLIVPHNNREITFIHPLSKGNCFDVDQQLQAKNLQDPTFGENISLLYSASKKNVEEYSKEILNLIKNESMWCFTGSLYLPKRKEYFSNGVIVQDRPQIQEGIIMDKSELVKKLKNGKKVKGVLFSEDGSVRFVHFGYKTGEQTPQELGRNHYLLALTGSEETREKLVELASKYSGKPYLHSYGRVDSEMSNISCLWTTQYRPKHIVIDGTSYGFGMGRDIIAFGVSRLEV